MSSEEVQEHSIQEVEDPKILTLPFSQKKIAFSACHRIPERSFHWKGRPLLCYRCLGIDLGVILMVLLLLLGFAFPQVHPAYLLSQFLPNRLAYFFLFAIASQLPYIVDGSLQAVSSYQSNNPLRFLTGLLGGIGQFFLIFSIGALIARGIELVF